MRIAVGVVAMLGVLGVAVATARPAGRGDSAGGITCGAPIHRTAAHAPVVGPVEFRGIRSAVVPATKVLLVVRAATRGAVVLAGRRCADGTPLRFWYGTRPALPASVTPATGSRTYEIAATGPEKGRPGYFLPSKPGAWRVSLVRRRTVIGTFVFCASASLESPRPCSAR